MAGHERCARLFSAIEESGNVVGRVLAVAVHHERPSETAITRVFPPGAERRAFALVDRMAKCFGSGGGGLFRRAIRRAVIYHDHRRKTTAGGGSDFPDGGRFVETRNDDGTLMFPIHVSTLRQFRCSPME